MNLWHRRMCVLRCYTHSAKLLAGYAKAPGANGCLNTHMQAFDRLGIVMQETLHSKSPGKHASMHGPVQLLHALTHSQNVR
jgi:hypothetical protein